MGILPLWRGRVRLSVRRSVGPALFSKVKNTHTRRILCRVSGLVPSEACQKVFYEKSLFIFNLWVTDEQKNGWKDRHTHLQQLQTHNKRNTCRNNLSRFHQRKAGKLQQVFLSSYHPYMLLWLQIGFLRHNRAFVFPGWARATWRNESEFLSSREVRPTEITCFTFFIA